VPSKHRFQDHLFTRNLKIWISHQLSKMGGQQLHKRIVFHTFLKVLGDMLLALFKQLQLLMPKHLAFNYCLQRQRWGQMLPKTASNRCCEAMQSIHMRKVQGQRGMLRLQIRFSTVDVTQASAYLAATWPWPALALGHIRSVSKT
jgi:hypothetical protein